MTVTGLQMNCISTTKNRENSAAKETVSFSDVIREFEEKNRVTAEELKESDDWRNASDEAWNRLLKNIDNYIDACRETSREMVKRQQEAARKASLQASAGMKSIAASQASLAVAACGFFGGQTTETQETASQADGSAADDESDWTSRLGTDDQTVMRTARLAQEFEESVMSRILELGVS
ncbi:MAG: hypothetical protein K6G45_01960 [Lachnospiraceae bacterium]|nr:hypothetical protein [Lachnospiraceae bacterium]